MEAVGWGMASVRPAVGARIHVAFQPEKDCWGGRERVRLAVKDLTDACPAAQALTEEACLRWDPLGPAAPCGAPAVTLDGRGDRLPALLARLAESAAEVAAAAEGVDDGELEAESARPSRLTYVEMLARADGARVLLLAASPWAAAALADRLRGLMPDRRQEVRLWLPGEPEPAAGAVVVAAHGQAARGPYTDVVYYHPPYQESGCPGERLHLVWQEADWALAEASLGWPYPEREHLVHLYKLLRRGEGSPERLAALVGEPFGPWSRLRWESGLAVFREVGLLGPDGALLPSGNGARFDLESSPRYRRGLTARQRMATAKHCER